jgi:hypothetical protein
MLEVVGALALLVMGALLARLLALHRRKPAPTIHGWRELTPFEDRHRRAEIAGRAAEKRARAGRAFDLLIRELRREDGEDESWLSRGRGRRSRW